MSCSIVRHENGTVAKVLAPNGKESVLYKSLIEDVGLAPETALKKWAMTQTRTFKHWFGDSVIVDKNGEPKLVYHAGPEAIEVFDKDRSRTGFWFTDQKDAAINMAKFSTGMQTDELELHPVFLNIKSTKKYENFWSDFAVARDSEGNMMRKSETIENAYKEGYDGIFIGEDTFMDAPSDGISYAHGEQMIAFDPDQIKHAVDNYGTFTTPDMSPLLAEVEERYGLRTETGARKAIANPTDVIDRIHKNYPGVDAFVERIAQGNVIGLTTNDLLSADNIYHQQQSADIREANEDLDAAMSKLMEELGVKVDMNATVIRNSDGQVVNAIAKADIVNNLIQIVAGKAGVDTLSEEAAHFIVELLEASGSPLFTSMMNMIEGYDIYKEVANNEFYVEQYSGNVNKLKKEAIGKLIAKNLVKQAESNDTKQKQSRAQRWFERVMNFVNKLFGRAVTDPYARTAALMLNKEILKSLNVRRAKTAGVLEMFQDNPNIDEDPRKGVLQNLDEFSDQFKTEGRNAEQLGLKQPWFVEDGPEVDRYVGVPGSKYEGVVIIGRVSDEVKKYFYKRHKTRKKNLLTAKENESLERYNNLRKESGTLGHKTMEDLVKYHTKKTDLTIQQIFQNSPFKKNQFDKLDKEVIRILKAIKGTQNKINKENGTKEKAVIRTEQFLLRKTGESINEGTGGTIDLIAIFSDGSAEVYDWKFVSPSIEKGYVQFVPGKGYQLVKDPFDAKMDTYNIQVGHYKQTLLEQYGVTKIRKSRIVPIHVRFKYVDKQITSEITTLQVGSDSEFLEQIPVAEEMTDFESINILISKALTRSKRMQQELDNKDLRKGKEWFQIKDRKAKLDRQIRKLQLNQDVKFVLEGIQTELKDVLENLAVDDEFITEKGKQIPNPDYMDLEELQAALSDTMFYMGFLETSDYNEYLNNEGSEQERKEYAEIRQQAAGFLTNLKSALEDKLMVRAVEFSEARGVKGLKDFNTSTDFITEKFVTLSKQNNPYLRTLYNIVTDVQHQHRKSVKTLAEEIEDVQNPLLEWGKNNGYEGVKVFDLIINNDSGNLAQKYTREFYVDRANAIKSGNLQWLQNNTEINKEKFDKKFPIYRKQYLTNLKRKFKDNSKAIDRELLIYDKMHNIVKFPKTAMLSHGGRWFLKPKDMHISPEYQKIQSTPALKNFYDFYIEKTMEFEEMFGQELGPGFIANIHKNTMEHLLDDGFKGMSKSMLESLQIREHDLSFGIRDENSGELIRRVPRLYIRPLVDSKGNIDHSLKSRDIGKSLLLLGSAAMDYKLKDDVLPEIESMRMLLENNIATEIQVDNLTGKILTNLSGTAKQIFDSKGSSKVFNDFVDQYIYGSQVGSNDFNVLGLSGIKSLMSLKMLHSQTTLGLKAPVAFGAFIAGQFGLRQQASKGVYITPDNLVKAQKALMTADPKMRALAEHFDIYQFDIVKERADRLSGRFITKHLTNDKWFAMLGTADRGIDAIGIYALALNYGLDENGAPTLLSRLPNGSKSIVDIMELEEDPKWSSTIANVSKSARNRYKVKIGNMQDSGEINFRQIARRISDKVKGSMSDEDKALYNNTLFLRLLMHYKSWLPGVAMERFGRARYDHILKNFDQGTWTTSIGNLGGDITIEQLINAEVGVAQLIGAYGQDLGKVALDVVTFGMTNTYKVNEKKARAAFDQFIAQNITNPEFAERFKDPVEKEKMYQEFLDMKRGNIKAFMMEFRGVMLLGMLLMLMGGDWDDDGKIDMRQSWAGRQLYKVMNRAYRETAVFVDPREFMDSRSTGIPLISMASNIVKLASNTADTFRDVAFGQNDKKDKTGPLHYTPKFVPGLDAVFNVLEVRETDKTRQR